MRLHSIVRGRQRLQYETECLFLSVEFSEEIEIMRSLARPRKLTIQGSDGQIYMFLGKPKDDLRKDARLMDFNAIINKLLKSNSESRRRQLRELNAEAVWVILVFMGHLSRHSNVWSCHSERRMWFYSVGSEYNTYTPYPRQGIRGTGSQTMGQPPLAAAPLCILN